MIDSRVVVWEAKADMAEPFAEMESLQMVGFSYLRMVDTGSDVYAVIMTRTMIPMTQAQEIWEQRYNSTA